MSDHTLGKALISETRRRLFDESIPRIRTCLNHLSEEEVWQRPGPTVTSVGNLVLHLCGNARQWICAGLAGAPDNRDRDSEFMRAGGMDKAALIAHLDAAMADVDAALDAIDPGTLLDKRPVQVFEETGVSILVHVIEHFSYHVGQITWHTKAMKEVDTGYYASLDLTKKPE